MISHEPPAEEQTKGESENEGKDERISERSVFEDGKAEEMENFGISHEEEGKIKIMVEPAN